jgi:hypothetical protein
VDGAPISFAEIEAWTRLTGVALTAWEAGSLRALSVAYMGEYLAGSDPERLPPFSAITQIDRKAVGDRRKAQMERLERQDAKRR